MSVSDIALRKAKPREKSYKISDGGGLFLRINPNGSKLWRMKYRVTGREKLLSFGAYPIISLVEASRMRDDAKRSLTRGTDPALKRKQEKLATANAANNTFGVMVAEY